MAKGLYTFGSPLERALLVGVQIKKENFDFEGMMQELTSLAKSAGLLVSGSMVQKNIISTPAYFIGKGKVEELKKIIGERDIDVIIFSCNLQPIQHRNLEEKLGVKVIDRTELILDIFAQRAKSREGKLQVELAQLEYLLPRLTGKGKMLSRLGGGIGTRGPGEKKLETDRRRIKKRIDFLLNQLERIKKHRQLHRKQRKKRDIFTAALIGYTNSGKSTLLNKLSGTRVYVADKLFATLDPKVGKVFLREGKWILLVDTVGFIKNLPHTLISAFRATLEEVQEADILLHIIDAANFTEEHSVAVMKVLEELGVTEKLIIPVFNKIDLIDSKEKLKSLARFYPDAVFISALKGIGIKELTEKLFLTITLKQHLLKSKVEDYNKTTI